MKNFSVFLTCLLFFSPRDARGMTPFMSAVSGRAYPAAITILETAQKIAKGTPVLVTISVCFPSKVWYVCRFIINSAFFGELACA